MNRRQIPDPPVVRNPEPLCSAPLYLGRFDVTSRSSDHNYEQTLKKTMAHFIGSRRAYAVISELPNEKEKLAPDFFILDSDMAIVYDEDYNWWLSWPAVYPLSAYWPLQMREGTMNVKIEFTLMNREGKVLHRFSVKKSDSQEVTFYGFFRTSPLEDLIQQTIGDAMRDAARQIAEKAEEVCSKAEEKR